MADELEPLPRELPPLPLENEDPWYIGRTEFDEAVRAHLEGRLSEEVLEARIAYIINRINMAQTTGEIAGRASDIANEKAEGALASASGKNKNYYQEEEPLEYEKYNVGDLWFDIDDNYCVYTWNGTSWILTQDSFGAMAKADQALLDVLNAVQSSTPEYVVTDSAVIAPGPEAPWDPDTPDWGPGQFVWRRTKDLTIGGAITYTNPVMITGPDGQAGEDAVLLRIFPVGGDKFKNNTISSVLTVTVFVGSRQITDIDALWAEFGMTAYLEWHWKRKDDSDYGLISASDTRLSRGGFALTVSPNDVDETTDFVCELHT